MPSSSHIPSNAVQVIRSSLIVGIQFDDAAYRAFLREYHRDLRTRFPSDNFPAFSPTTVLEELMFRYEPACTEAVAGARHEALRQFAQRVHRLDLSLTSSDFGPFEQRTSPYRFDRAFYHLGREIGSAKVKMEFPGYNPYRSTRKLDLPTFRDNVESVVELFPDYLSWALHDHTQSLAEVLAPAQVEEVRTRLEASGFETESLGLYLVTMETLHIDGDPLD